MPISVCLYLIGSNHWSLICKSWCTAIDQVGIKEGKLLRNTAFSLPFYRHLFKKMFYFIIFVYVTITNHKRITDV